MTKVAGPGKCTTWNTLCYLNHRRLRCNVGYTVYLRPIGKLVVNFPFVLFNWTFSPDVTAQALQSNIDWKSAFLKGLISFGQIFHVVGDVPREPFLHGLRGRWMPYNFVPGSIHTKKLCSRLSSSEVQFHAENDLFRFWAPSGGFRGNVRCVFWAYWKPRSGLPISVILTFSLGVTAEARQANIDWKSAFSLQQGEFAPKISGRRGRFAPTVLFVRKLGWIVFHVHGRRSRGDRGDKSPQNLERGDANANCPPQILSYKYKNKRSVAFKIRQNPFSAGALPRTPLGELTSLP